MNADVQAAQDRRHRFTVEQLWALADSDSIELIDGDLVDVPDDGPLHIDWSAALGRWLWRSLDDGYVVVPGSTLRLSDHDAPKPDWYVFAASTRTSQVRGPDVRLAIEQSRTSLRFDLGRKADLYARYGVRDYWAIDLERRRLHRFRDPGAEGYRERAVFEADEVVESLLIPGLTLRLADLPRVGRGP